jgi:MFS family permease
MNTPFSTVDRRNFVINVAEGVLYVAGAAFISGQTVLPALVSRLGGGNVAVGSVAVILWVGLVLPQVFAARYVETLPWKKPWAIWGGTSQRMFILLLAASVFLFGERNPAVALMCVLICFALNQVALGITTPGWFDLFAKVTPLRKRGRLIGMRNSVGGAAAFLCGLALTWMLARFSFPVNYSLAFLCAFVFQILSIVVQTNLVEGHPSNTVARKPFGTYVRQLPAVLRQNKRFRWFIVMSAFLVIASMPAGFFTVYALGQYGGDESVVGRFTLAMVAIQVVSAFANGYIADHYGHKIALVLAAAGMFCASIVALLASSLAWFTVVYVFLGINLGSELMLRYNMSVEYGPVEQRSTYVGLMNTALAPFYLSSIAAGWISDLFGYQVVFVLGAVSSIIGIVVLIFFVEDPHASDPSACGMATVAVDGEYRGFR